jgi:hypothetical protein
MLRCIVNSDGIVCLAGLIQRRCCGRGIGWRGGGEGDKTRNSIQDYR